MSLPPLPHRQLHPEFRPGHLVHPADTKTCVKWLPALSGACHLYLLCSWIPVTHTGLLVLWASFHPLASLVPHRSRAISTQAAHGQVASSGACLTGVSVGCGINPCLAPCGQAPVEWPEARLQSETSSAGGGHVLTWSLKDSTERWGPPHGLLCSPGPGPSPHRHPRLPHLPHTDLPSERRGSRRRPQGRRGEFRAPQLLILHVQCSVPSPSVCSCVCDWAAGVTPGRWVEARGSDLASDSRTMDLTVKSSQVWVRFTGT